MFKKETLFLQPIFVILLLGILYILLPSINPSGDSYMYANQIKNGTELFLPHHLLYNAFYFILAKVFVVSDTLRFISLMNGIFAIGCLVFINEILQKYTTDKTRFFLILFLGSCFGFMRYATTGETYIVPLFFALWASWSALRQQKIIFTAIIAGIACLFHQIYIFWWFGLLVFAVISHSNEKTKKFIMYVLGSCIVPFVYLAAFYFTPNDSKNIFEYIIHDYVNYEDVGLTFKTQSLLLTPISFIRTFYQVHGYLIPLIQKYWILSAGIILSVIFGVTGLLKLRQTKTRKNHKQSDKKFAYCHLLIFFLQLIFASISEGNAEFMTMLPFAFSIFLFIRYKFQHLPIYAFSLSIFFWNICLGLLPYHFIELTSNPALARYIQQFPSEIYFVKDRQTVKEYLEYHSPNQKYQLYKINREDQLDSFLKEENNRVLSDILTPEIFSRASMVQPDSTLKAEYTISAKDSIPYDLGILIIGEIKK